MSIGLIGVKPDPFITIFHKTKTLQTYADVHRFGPKIARTIHVWLGRWGDAVAGVAQNKTWNSG